MREVLSSVVVPVSIDVAWDTYLDFESWGLRGGFYDRIEWLSGKPWQQHSRARLHQLWPTPQIVLVRVLQSHRPDLLSGIYHANGLTSTKSVRFHSRDQQSTEVKIQTECLGEALDQAVISADVVLRKMYEQSLKDFAAECIARSSRHPQSEDPDLPSKTA